MPKLRLKPEEWETLRASPAGDALRAWALEEIEEIRSSWENGNLTGDDRFKTEANNLAAIGACRVLRKIAALEYDDIFGDSGEQTVEHAGSGDAGAE